ncbi:MAG: hypothetical protein U0793_04080 [Gemmataceae bacterium]
MRPRLLLIGLVGLGGCLGEEQTLLVGGNPFNQPAQLAPVTRSSYAPAGKEVALKVDQAGQKIAINNPQLGFHPVFATIGSPRLEIFHAEAAIPNEKDSKLAPPAPVVYITEGLVKRCANDLELSAVLSYELGRIVAERDAKVSPAVRNPERPLPIRVPVGDSGRGGPDLTAVAEIGKFEKQHPKSVKTITPPDPAKIAAKLLERAGLPPATLETVDALLKEADSNAALERQIKGGVPTWSPE